MTFRFTIFFYRWNSFKKTFSFWELAFVGDFGQLKSGVHDEPEMQLKNAKDSRHAQ